MVESEESGIAFSVHPVTQDRNQLIIEAGFGLGEAIVSGQITPDSYVVLKDNLKILDKNTNEQAKGLYRNEKGGNEWKNLGEKGKEQVLTDKEITELSKLIIKIEELYGFPVDVEWAREKGKFYIVQSRPITTLEKGEKKKEETKLINLYTDVNSTPLTLSVNLMGWTDNWIINASKIKDFGKMALLVKGYEQGFCIEIEKFKKAHENIADMIKNNALPLDLAIKKSIEIGESIKIQVLDNYYNLEHINKSDLLELFLRLFENGRVLCSYGFIAPLSDFPEPFLSEKLEKILAEHSSKKDIAFLIQSSSKRPSQIAREELLEIISNNLEIESWIKKWFWLEFGHLGPALTIEKIKEDYKEYFKDPKKAKEELLKIKKENKKLKQEQEAKFNKLKINQEKNLFYQAQKISFLKAYRTDILFCLYAFIDRILEIYSKKTGIEKELLRFSKKEEVGELIKNNKAVEKKELLARRDNSVWITQRKDDFYDVISGKEADEFIKENIISEELKNIENTIKGKVAFPGRVKGIAKIIKEVKDIDKVNDGDIIIAPQTSPEFLPAMKKASAFVTNIGGITSHAAIVAREMRKPCLIGAKDATKIIKDGDEIEVDTNHGIVKILERTEKTKEKKKEYSNLKSSDYVRMFEGTGMPLLINTIAFKYYMPWEVIAIFRKNLWTTYLPKKSEKQTLKEGIDLFSNKRNFNRYKKEFEDYKKESKKFLDNITTKSQISFEELKKSFEFIALHWKYYQKTEFFYVDDAFKESKNNKIIKENLKELEDIKNSGRIHLNNLIFGDNSYLTKIMNVLSKQFNKKIEDLFFYTSKELFNLYNKKEIEDDILNERKKSYTLIGSKDKETILQGNESESFINNFLTLDLNITEIKGITANPGKARGKAKVIRFGYKDFDKVHKEIESMNKGDILIAETTAPELMAACKKASAIVKNQGGFLSHAAIVSRELGIPCLVGTEIAVEVIKDGDLVEVDADEGVVRILHKN